MAFCLVNSSSTTSSSKRSFFLDRIACVNHVDDVSEATCQPRSTQR
jgi:hypothetical protein